jgi:hypothetical protein
MKPAEKLESLYKEIDEVLDGGLESFLEDYKKEVKDNKAFIYIQLWTPDWNDGEPCLHSVDYCIGPQIIDYEYFENESEMFAGISKEEIEESSLLYIEERDMSGVIKCLERSYETNKQCLIIIDSDKIVSIARYYDCGY